MRHADSRRLLRRAGSAVSLSLILIAAMVSLFAASPAHATGGSLCPSGTTFNSTTSQCQAPPTCPSGLSFNSADNECEVSPNCPAGTSLSSGVCSGSASGLCPAGTSFVSGVGCETSPSCPSGYALLASGLCSDGGSSCPPGYALAASGPSDVIGLCFDGTPSASGACPVSTDFIVSGVCVLNVTPTSCPSGYAMEASGAFCFDGSPTCSSGDTFDPSTGLCQPSGTSACPSSTDIVFSGVCVYYKIVVCPSGTDFFSGGACIYQNGGPDSCPTGTTFNSATAECVVAPACPAGTSFDGTSSCTGSAANFCPSGTTFNSSTSQCESSPTCPTGTAFNATSHLCLLQVISIAIKPQDSPAAINIKKDSTVTVAILGSPSFSVYAITASPLSAAPKFGGSTPQSPVHVAYEDVNNDGIIDLVLQYKLAGLGFTISSTQGCVSGTLNDGTPIVGCAAIKVVNS